LVSCYALQVLPEAEIIKYPYKYGGIETPPETLGGIEGFFAWDARRMKPIDSTERAA